MTQTDKLKNEKFMNEKMNTKRFLLCLSGSIKYLFMAIIFGAVLAAVLYLAVTNIGKETEYEIANDYYIVFNEKEYPNGMDYYNAYTWNNFVTDDKIVDAALTKCSLSKEEIRNSVSSLMLGDYRVLTVVVRNTDKEKVMAISEAYKYAMPEFANAVGELSSIELWSENPIGEVEKENHVANAGLLGAVIAMVIFGFVFAFKYAMDDSIRVGTDLGRLEFLGYDLEAYKNDLEANIKKITEDKEVIYINDVTKDAGEDIETKYCIINAVFGKTCMTKLEYDLDLLKKKNIECLGVVIKDADEKFLNRYYGIR